jgi:hypothetical protein
MEDLFPNINPAGSGDGQPRGVIEYYNQAIQALDLLYEAAAAGQDGAKEALRFEANRLLKRGAQCCEPKDVTDQPESM